MNVYLECSVVLYVSELMLPVCLFFRNELKKVREKSAWESFVLGTFWASAKLVILFAILCYLFSGYQLSAERIFVAVGRFSSKSSHYNNLVNNGNMGNAFCCLAQTRRFFPKN